MARDPRAPFAWFNQRREPRIGDIYKAPPAWQENGWTDVYRLHGFRRNFEGATLVDSNGGEMWLATLELKNWTLCTEEQRRAAGEKRR